MSWLDGIAKATAQIITAPIVLPEKILDEIEETLDEEGW